LYCKLFYFIEQQNILNEQYLWVLHYVYLPRINQALRVFVSSWNNHPIRTANHKSPQQLSAGELLLQNSGLAAMDFFSSVDEDNGVNPQYQWFAISMVCNAFVCVSFL